MAATGVDTVTVTDRVTLQVTFTTDGSEEAAADIKAAANWSLTPKAPENPDEPPAHSCMPFKIVAYTTGLGATLTMHPEYTQNTEYTIKYKTFEKKFTTPATLVPTAGELEFPKGFIEILTLAFSLQAQTTSGRPETYLLKDFDPSTETVIFTEGSYAFPGKGELWIGPNLFVYTDAYHGGFKGVAQKPAVNLATDPKPWIGKHIVAPLLDTIPETTFVACNVDAIPPEGEA
jgi:hypothetical protein